MVVSNCRGRGEVLVTSHLRVDFPLHVCDYNDVRGGGVLSSQLLWGWENERKV